MTEQQSETLKNDVNAIVEAQPSGLIAKLEDPMWQAIFASVTTISLWGFVIGGIAMMDAIVN